MFTGNPRGWALSEGRPAEDAAFREGCAESGIRVVIHAPYLVNLGSPTPATYERSVASVAHNVRRAVEIGAEGVVVHTGSYVDATGADGLLEAALTRVREGLLPILDTIEDEQLPWLLLEPTAGQGRSLCAGVEDLEPLPRRPRPPPQGRASASTPATRSPPAPAGRAGRDDRGPSTAWSRSRGPGKLRLVHANDS